MAEMTRFKITFSSIKTPYTHLPYVHNKYARFQKEPLKNVGAVDYTNSILQSVMNGRADRQIGANLNAPPTDYGHRV